MIYDHVEIICDLMVDELNDVDNWEDGRPEYRFVAEKTDNPLDKLNVEDPNLRVYVTPFNEVERIKTGRGGQFVEDWQADLLVVKTIPEADTTYTRTRLSRFEKTLATHLRRLGRLGQGLRGRYFYMGSEMDAKYDRNLWREKRQFASLRRITYTGTTC